MGLSSFSTNSFTPTEMAGVVNTTGGTGLSSGSPAAPYVISYIPSSSFTDAWFDGQDREAFWPEVVLSFAVREPAEHHHVPLLLSPFAYSTYRGS